MCRQGRVTQHPPICPPLQKNPRADDQSRCRVAILQWLEEALSNLGPVWTTFVAAAGVGKSLPSALGFGSDWQFCLAQQVATLVAHCCGFQHIYGRCGAGTRDSLVFPPICCATCIIFGLQRPGLQNLMTRIHCRAHGKGHVRCIHNIAEH